MRVALYKMPLPVRLFEIQPAAEHIASYVVRTPALHVAYRAQRLEIPAKIVMPINSPFTKVRRTATFGARIV